MYIRGALNITIAASYATEVGLGTARIDQVSPHSRQRRRGCRGRIPGNIWSAGDEMSYILPKVSQNCYQIACRTDAYERDCDSPYFA